MCLKFKSVYFTLLLTLFASVFSSCNSEIDIPSYIYVENVDFTVSDREAQGTASHYIPIIFVTVNGTDIGCYQLPALVPVIAEGKTNIMIRPGIYLNGIRAQRVAYPFYTTPVESVLLTKERVDTLRPSSTYISDARFEFIDTFEEDTKFSLVEGAPLTLGNEDHLRFYYPGENNGKYGIITISPEDTLPYFEIKSPRISKLPLDCFVELNYWFTEDIEVGIYCYTSNPVQFKNKKMTLYHIAASKPQNGETWKKIYLNLTKDLNDASTEISMNSFEVFFSGSSSNGKEARFLFDNIKLIYR